MTDPSPKRDPKAPPKELTVTKADAALSQLETAITLWFNYGYPISILALATAANDCYAALGGHVGHTSFFQTWFRSQSHGVQDRIRDMQNFIKHGRRRLTGSVRLAPRLAEVLIVDSASCHQNVFRQSTVLMSLFAARFALENPGLISSEFESVFRQELQVYDLAEGNRTEFAKKAFERIGTLASGRE